MKNGRYDEGDAIRWYINDQLHRSDGPAVEKSEGSRVWYLNDQLHREDGPAIEWSTGSKAWWLHGKAHREDGPAVEWSTGRKEWYLNGAQHTEQEFQQWLDKKNLNEKLHATLEQKPK